MSMAGAGQATEVLESQQAAVGHQNPSAGMALSVLNLGMESSQIKRPFIGGICPPLPKTVDFSGFLSASLLPWLLCLIFIEL